jgi:hypothetical protein
MRGTLVFEAHGRGVAREQAMSKAENQRRFFRIEYPQADRPTIVIDDRRLSLLELSEMGLKVLIAKGYAPKVDDFVRGTILLSGGRTLDVEGSVLRLISNPVSCVVRLDYGVPLPVIMEEQRRLIAQKRDEDDDD